MKPFFDDMGSDLDKIQRGWVRIPVTIILTVVIMIVAIFYGAIVGIIETVAQVWNEFTMECFIGPEKEDETVDL